MTTIIELLRGEHRDIEELLLVLEEELSIFDRTGRLDYKIIQAIIDYFQDYPDYCHHPKEDMIFERLQARDPVMAENIGDLEAAHQNEAKRLQRVADMIGSILRKHEAPGQTIDDVLRDFIKQEREHMKMEERVLFPAALNALHPEDWTQIELKWSDQKDSLFNVAIDERCHSLRDRVLQWKQKNEEARI